jgi:beta-galactosidase beta subunit
MGVYPVAKATVSKEYDEKKDVANYTAEGKFYVGTAGLFLFSFHRMHTGQILHPVVTKSVKKIVIKVRVS